MDKSIPQDLVEVGRIAEAYGVQGMVKIIPFASDSVLLHTGRWWLMRSTVQGVATEPMYAAQLIRARAQGAGVVARFATVRDRDQAQSLKGTTVYVSRADFPKAQNDEFYWVDLLGCRVYSRQSEPAALIGVVTQVSDNGAHGVLHIKRQSLDVDGQLQDILGPKGKLQESLIPFVKEIVPEVDVERQYIGVEWPVDF